MKKWATQHQCWIDVADLGTYEDRGSENEVYLSVDENVVFKLNDFRYSDEICRPFLNVSKRITCIFLIVRIN